MKYFRGIYQLCLKYNFISRYNDLEFVRVYFDFDYTIDQDDRRLIFKYIIIFGKVVISWVSRRQKSVIIFILKVKYMALYQAVKKVLWYRNILY